MPLERGTTPHHLTYSIPNQKEKTMDKRKKLVNEYKERKLHGGIYTITNKVNGKYFLGHAVDLKAARNRFEFAVVNGSGTPLKLQDDLNEFGGEAFAFKVLEELEPKKNQSRSDFIDDLKTLEQLWREKLDSANEY